MQLDTDSVALILSFQRGKRGEAARTRQTIQTSVEHFLQVLIDTQGNKTSYLLFLKPSTTSGMF